MISLFELSRRTKIVAVIHADTAIFIQEGVFDMSTLTTQGIHQPAVTAEERMNRIVEDGMCIGCGLCESIAGRDTIQIHTVQTGYERPVVVGELSQETVDKIYDVCPGLRLDTLPRKLIDADTIIDPIWGPYKYMVSAHASNENTRIKAASGGVLTALSQFLIESKRVSFILHAKPSTRDATFGDAHISLTVSDVAAGTGSIYGPTAPLKNIRAVLDRGEPFAFVGKPCDISALRNYALYDERVNELVKYWLTPVCGGIVPPGQMDKFLESRGTTRKKLKWFKYRGDGCPGDTEFETTAGVYGKASMYEPYGGVEENSWQLPFRCKVCPDGPGEGADISAGDQWENDVPDWEFAKTDKGSNAMIIRTAAGSELMEAAVKAGFLTIEREIGPRWYDTCQHHQVVKKMYTRARWDGLRAEGRVTPRSQGLRLDLHASLNSRDTNEAQKTGTQKRLRNGQEDEPTPRKLM